MPPEKSWLQKEIEAVLNTNCRLFRNRYQGLIFHLLVGSTIGWRIATVSGDSILKDTDTVNTKGEPER
jgi:hypothetical protein